MKLDKDLLFIKLHFFLFYAAVGPLLSQIFVYGRQLGFSVAALGVASSVMPLLWATAKPTFGYIVDYWPKLRKFVFMLLIFSMTGSYCSLWFLPQSENKIDYHTYKLNDTVHIRKYNYINYDNDNNSEIEYIKNLTKFNCQSTCINVSFEVFFNDSQYIDSMYFEDIYNISCLHLNMESNNYIDGNTICKPKKGCDFVCFKDEHSVLDKRKVNLTELKSERLEQDNTYNRRSYNNYSFWIFIILSTAGCVAFNVAYCISDAVCFDILGSNRSSMYGNVRVWGTLGYGVTAILGGWLVDRISIGLKDLTPAFIIAIVATSLDLLCCRTLHLPPLSRPQDSGKALKKILRIPRVMVFLLFAIIIGMFDSIINFYMFWFLEDLADKTGHVAQIKLIEGVVVAGQAFVGEMLFFYLSGYIIKKMGYGNTLTMCLFFYSLRLTLVSFIWDPWHLVFIEAIMQGPTYALCYATIVGYAAHVAPVGYSATVQGIVAGMDDGLGYALGSLIGGVAYDTLGGRGLFRGGGAVAAAAAIAHAVLYAFVASQVQDKAPENVENPTFEEERMLPSSVYRATTVAISNNQSSSV